MSGISEAEYLRGLGIDSPSGRKPAEDDLQTMIEQRAGRGRTIAEQLGVSEADLDASMARTFGREVSPASIDEAARAAGKPTTADFLAVGLCGEDALKAARGVWEGSYISFEDACLARTIWDTQRKNRLNQNLMREMAPRFADGKPVES